MKLTLFLILTFIHAGSYFSQTDLEIIKLNPLPTFGRDNASGFAIQNLGYICCGSFGVEGGFEMRQDFWRYDPNQDSWSQLPNFPGEPRQFAMSFENENYGYVIGGQNSNTFFNDMWRFDPLNEVWQEMAPFPGAARAAGSIFTANGFAYLGTGRDNTEVFKDFWKYDIENDQWTQLSDFPGGLRFETNAFFQNGKGFLGLGRNENFEFQNDIWTFDLLNEIWQEECDILEPLAYTQAEIAGDYVILFGGQYSDLTLSNTAIALDLTTQSNDLCNLHEKVIEMEKRRESAGFSIGDSAYFLGGLFLDNIKTNELYRISTENNDRLQKEFISFYANGTILFDSEEIIDKVKIFNQIGQIIALDYPFASKGSIHVPNTKPGIYIVSYESKLFSGSVKLLVTND